RLSGTARPSALAVVRLMKRSNLVRLLDRELGWLRSAQNLIDQVGSSAPHVSPVRSIGHQTSHFHRLPYKVHRRESRDECEGIDTNPVYEKERNGRDVQCLGTALECLESGTDIFGSPDFKHVGFERESMCYSVDLVYFASGERITNVGQHRQTAQTGDDLTQQFDPLASRRGCQCAFR